MSEGVLEGPFEIYRDCDISDANGHVCTAENTEIAEAIVAALAAAQRVAGEDRTFWVVEHFENGKSLGYWGGGSSRTFDRDIDKAVQFCRRQDAMWVIVGWHWKDVQITEHMMLPALALSPGKVEE